MSYKISKRTKSILASLSVSSIFLNFGSQNIKCMDNIINSQQQNVSEDVRCVNNKFILDMLKDYAYYKQSANYLNKQYDGYIHIDKKINDDLKYLKTKVFNDKNLTHDFPVIGYQGKFYIEEFNSYAVIHTIRAFFEKHKPIRLVFNRLYNERLTDMQFLIKEFDNTDNTQLSGSSVLDPFKSITLKTFWNNWNKNGNYVGFEKYNSWVNNRFMPNLVDSNGENITLAYELYNGLSSETRKEIEKMINNGKLNKTELYGMLCIIYNTLHELTHCTIYCLRHYGPRSMNPIFRLTCSSELCDILNYDFENYFRDNDFSRLHEKFKSTGICEGPLYIKIITTDLKILKNDMNSGKRYDADKRISQFHGFTDRSTVDHNEFIAELGALGNMPSFHNFSIPKDFVKLLDFYAKLAYEYEIELCE